MSDLGDHVAARRRFRNMKYELVRWSSALPRLRRALRRGKAKRRPEQPAAVEPPRVLFEPLEPRYLLSADLSPLVIAMADAGHDLTLHLDANDMLQVINDQTGSVVGEQQASRTSQVQIIGSGNDQLTIALTAGFALPLGIEFDGGSGHNSLLLTGIADEIAHSIAGDGSGTMSAKSGNGIESLIYSGVQQVTDSITAQSRSISVSGSGNDVSLASGNNGGTLLTTALGESIGFGSSANSLSINAEANLLNQAFLAADQIALHGHALSIGGTLDAHGNIGGGVDLTGSEVDLLDGALIDASGLSGGGTVHVGGDLHGAGPLQDAQDTTVARGATIDVSATQSGAGGQAVIWADGSTNFAGSILARGGSSGGDGGYVEVSGKDSLAFTGDVNAGASAGSAGTLLLDPNNADIISGSGSIDGQTPNFIASGSSTISVAALENITATTNITITATDNITIDNLGGTALAFQTSSGHSVTFSAGGTFSFQNASDSITTMGGDVSITAATIGLLGSFNVGAGTLTLDETGSGDVTLNSITAGALNVTSAGNILETGSAAVVVSGITTLNAGTNNITLGQSGNDFGTLVVTNAGNVTVTDENAIILGSLHFTGTFSLTATGVTATGTSLTLTNTQLTIGSQNIVLTGVKTATLNADATNASTLDITGFTGTATLVGGSGGDTYKFGSVFHATLQAQPGNNDLLDFTQYGDTSALSVTTTASDVTITDGTSSLDQKVSPSVYAPAPRIDATLTASEKTALSTAFAAFLSDLVTLAGKVEGGALSIPELTNTLPVLTSQQNVNGRLANVLSALGLKNAFTKFQTLAAFSTPTKLSDLVADLLGLTFTAPSADDTLAVGVTTASFGYNSSGPLQWVLNTTVKAENKEPFNIDLGSQAQLLGISIPGTLDLDTVLTAPVQGVFTPNVNTETIPSATLDFQATETNTAKISNPSLGFIDGSIAAGGIDLTGELAVSITSGIPGSPSGTITTNTDTLNPIAVSVTATGLSSATQTLLSGANSEHAVTRERRYAVRRHASQRGAGTGFRRAGLKSLGFRQCVADPGARHACRHHHRIRRTGAER
jgi:hypothetical protein